MEKGKKIEILEFPLPQPIVQHIQSFLNEKHAAQTTVLSKLWYYAWLTRPILDLDELNFSKRGDGGPKSQIEDGFSEFARNTMQRYQELNLKIESFRLSMKNLSGRNSLANELILKALKMGVNDFSLEIKPPDPSLVGDNDFNFEINTPDLTLVLPQEVLGSKNLTRLSVCGCTVKLPVDGKISCSRLKFLSLSKVCINIVWDIISSCPLIEKLSLSDCECWVEDKTVGISMMETWMWTTPSVESCEFHRLKYLSLFRVSVDSFFFHDFSRKFPCLEDLSLLHCNVYEGIRLSSHSLRCINPACMRMLRAEFDVPSIRKFMYSGISIPSLSFPTSSGEWESDINIICHEHCLRAKWFGDLKKLLTELSLSKISLNLMLFLEMYIDCVGLIEGLPKPIVENLILSIYKSSASCSPLLDGLFWCCRPKFITQYLLHRALPAVEKIDFLELICKRRIPDVNQNCYLPSQNMSDLHDLEEVYAEIFEQTLAEWQPLPLKSLLDAFTDPELAQKVRLRLKWSSPDHASSS